MLRYRNDSILISNKTLNIDNPQLNCRIQGLSNYSPKRIILDSNLSIKKKSYIFQSATKKNTIIFYNKAPQSKINQLIKKGVKLIKLARSAPEHPGGPRATDKNNFFDLKSVLNKIYFFGCRNLLVEGGKLLTSSFLKHKLFNQFYLFKSPNKLGKNAKLNISSQLNQLSFKYKKKFKLNAFTGKDIVYLYSK